MTEKRFTVPDRYQFSHSKVQLNGESLTNAEIVRLLNVNDGAFTENFALKQENKELKQFKEQLFDIIDERIKYHRKYSTLAVRIPMDCKFRKECLENHSVNVCNKAKENAYKELKKELGE